MDAHKNLNGLLQAWILLAKAGIFPRLSMIIPDQREFEVQWHQELHMARTLGCQIDLRSHLAHDDVLACLKSARALVFTSWCESLGLPLVEARMLKIPVIAPELDYVREVLDPVQTFDPTSTKSLARAIKRFMGVDDSKLDIQSGMDFIETVLK
jgi:glycosyltransferase involved in cell wall biosynthesis